MPANDGHNWFRDVMSFARLATLLVMCALLGASLRRSSMELSTMRRILERQESAYTAILANNSEIVRLDLRLKSLLEKETAPVREP